MLRAIHNIIHCKIGSTTDMFGYPSMVTIPFGDYLLWWLSPLVTIPFGDNPLWWLSPLLTIPFGDYPFWWLSPFVTMPFHDYLLWCQSTLVTILFGDYPLWWLWWQEKIEKNSYYYSFLKIHRFYKIICMISEIFTNYDEFLLKLILFFESI